MDRKHFQESSNFRELNNFVEKLEKEGASGTLVGAELFIFTDNTTTESAFHNGTSSSEKLFNLILRVRIVQMKFSVRVHMIHVSGERMIHQGTDGLSRGNLTGGVLSGDDMLSYIPISKSAHEMSPNLVQLIQYWSDSAVTPLSPFDWL